MDLKQELKKASAYYALSKTHKSRGWVGIGLCKEDRDKIKFLSINSKLPMAKVLSIIINEAYYKLIKEEK